MQLEASFSWLRGGAKEATESLEKPLAANKIERTAGMAPKQGMGFLI